MHAAPLTLKWWNLGTVTLTYLEMYPAHHVLHWSTATGRLLYFLHPHPHHLMLFCQPIQTARAIPEWTGREGSGGGVNPCIIHERWNTAWSLSHRTKSIVGTLNVQWSIEHNFVPGSRYCRAFAWRVAMSPLLLLLTVDTARRERRYLGKTLPLDYGDIWAVMVCVV